MKYYSTNKKSKHVNIKQAMLMGQAPDKGLFMPNFIPQLSKEEIVSFRNKKYWEIAFVVTKKFLNEDVPNDVLKKIVKDAYNFNIPVEHINNNSYILRLDQGPTASFKDFAARMMAELMNYFLLNENKKLLILVATSGDTGGAVADAYYQQNNINVVVLFPKNEVSQRQRKQMTTLGNNIMSIAVNGKFDDCQKMVKEAFADKELNHLNLSSANSINIGRLLPQIVYYFYAYSKVIGDEIIFSVPSGNFGDLMGGIIAKNMGLPIKKFIVAVNRNDEFVDFINSGIYKPIIPSKKCLSNAMNVGHPSNLSRLIDIYGGEMDEKGVINKFPDLKTMKKDIFTVSVNDQKTLETIKKMHNKYNIIIEPHGAVAWNAVEKYLKENPDEKTPIVSFETAHPAKFPEELNKLGINPKVPLSLIKLDAKIEIDNTHINADYNEFKKLLLEQYF